MGERLDLKNENWPSILANQIEQAERTPFEWGVNDCCLWSATVVDAMTGVDPAKDFRGLYSTEAEAKIVLESLGTGDIKSIIVSIFGEPIGIKLAQRGDVVLAIIDGQQTVGICVGGRTAFKSLTGLIQLPTLKCDCAWRVN